MTPALRLPVHVQAAALAAHARGAWVQVNDIERHDEPDEPYPELVCVVRIAGASRRLARRCRRRGWRRGRLHVDVARCLPCLVWVERVALDGRDRT